LKKINAVFTPKIETGATEGGLPKWYRPAPVSKEDVDMTKRFQYLQSVNKK
jgi:hypothetical protein